MTEEWDDRSRAFLEGSDGSADHRSAGGCAAPSLMTTLEALLSQLTPILVLQLKQAHPQTASDVLLSPFTPQLMLALQKVTLF